jgi:hypothetical protein
MLALVVARAAPPDPAIANDWLEWRSDPRLQWINRLDIVVAVDEYRRSILADAALAKDDRVPPGGQETCLET